MELALFFAEVDAQPWAELQHAYGSAADVPDCLRALAGDEDEASEALSELYGSILHQGSVYEATARAVPYLARLAEAGHRTEDLLVMLGGIAEGGEDRGRRTKPPAGRPSSANCRWSWAGLPTRSPGCGRPPRGPRP